MLSNILGDKTYIVKQFITECIGLIKGLLIVSHDEAVLYNDQQKIFHPDVPVSEDKAEWRYYLHLAGLKHSIDTHVVVNSIDTGTSFYLTKESIQAHPETKNLLLQFDYNYDALVSSYKEQEQYILACLLPVAYNVYDIVDLPSFSIVSYSPSHVEENEYNLIPKLSEFIENYKVTWMLPYYGMSDSLFLAAQYTIFNMALLKKVIAIRLSNARTFQAHSFHVKNYLASHHKLDDFHAYMTEQQRYFLYKNILFLDNHVGRTSIFNDLITKLFDDRNIAAFNHSFVQSNTLDVNSDIEYKFNKKYLNTGKYDYNLSKYSLQRMRTKEEPIAPGNKAYWQSSEKRITEDFKKSNFSRLLTKDIETSVNEHSDNVEYKYADVVLNNLLSLVYKNRLLFNVTVKNIKSGIAHQMSASDAYRLMVMAVLLRSGSYRKEVLTTFTLPTVFANRVFKDTVSLPTVSNILKSIYTTTAENSQIVFNSLTSVRDLLLTRDNGAVFSSANDTALYLESTYKLEKGLWIFKKSFSDFHVLGAMENGLNFFQEQFSVSLSDPVVFRNVGTSLNDFLSSVNFSKLTDFDDNELDNLIQSLFDILTSGGFSSLIKATAIQQAMMNIFATLTSYNVQFTNNFVLSKTVLTGAFPLSLSLRNSTYMDGTSQFDLNALYHHFNPN